MRKNKVQKIREATLFDLEKPAEAAAELERPYDKERGLLLGTSSFTAEGWAGTFYPAGLSTKQYLAHYARRFRTVEIDSTFYATPSETTVAGWYEKTPPDFVISSKVPQSITHEKKLLDCGPEFEEFVVRMGGLAEKRGPMLFQFPQFSRWDVNQAEFLKRLKPLLESAKALQGRFAVEIRNKEWLDGRLLDVLREQKVALALTDTSFMPRCWELKGDLDLITTDFVYVRWLGDRKGIEKQTTVWDKTVVDRTAELQQWVHYCRQIVRRGVTIFAYANNHYAGHGPGTVQLFFDLWRDGPSTGP